MSLQTPIDRILIIRLSHVGDVIHALPLLHALRSAYPEAHISWLAEDTVSPLLFNLDELDEPIVLPRRQLRSSFAGALRSLYRLLSRLRSRRFEAVIDVQSLTKSAIWGWLSGATTRIGFPAPVGRELAPWLNNVPVPQTPEIKHVVDLNMSLLGPLGVAPTMVRFDLPVCEHARLKVSKWLAEASPDRPPVLISPGAGWETKRWPAERFGALADRIAGDMALPVFIVWGPGEEDLCDRVLQNSQSSNVSAAPPTDLLEMTELIRMSRLVVTNDTGPLHIAVAVGVPTVSIWGPTDPERNGPYGPGHKVILTGAPCRMCWKTSCPAQNSLICMEQISVEEVWTAVREVLS